MGGHIIDDEFTDPDWEPDGPPPEWEKEQARFWEDQRDQADSEDGERAGNFVELAEGGCLWCAIIISGVVGSFVILVLAMTSRA